MQANAEVDINPIPIVAKKVFMANSLVGQADS